MSTPSPPAPACLVFHNPAFLCGHFLFLVCCQDKRYEIDFLLKLRPKPEGTPRPKELTPPGRVDILWDGKVGKGGQVCY